MLCGLHVAPVPSAEQSAAVTHCTHDPDEHFGVPPPQAWQDVPQWDGLDCTSTQVPPHKLWLLVAQVVAQPAVPSVRHPNAQLIIVAAPHAPAPLQARAVVRVPLVHEPAPQEVPLPG